MSCVRDEDYMASMTNTTNWYDGVFISSFSQYAAHYAHITNDERPRLPSQVNLPILIHITYPMEFLQEGQSSPFLKASQELLQSLMTETITVYWRLTSLIRGF